MKKIFILYLLIKTLNICSMPHWMPFVSLNELKSFFRAELLKKQRDLKFSDLLKKKDDTVTTKIKRYEAVKTIKYIKFKRK